MEAMGVFMVVIGPQELLTSKRIRLLMLHIYSVLYVNQTSIKWFLKERHAQCWAPHQSCYTRTPEGGPSRPRVVLRPAHSGKGRL